MEEQPNQTQEEKPKKTINPWMIVSIVFILISIVLAGVVTSLVIAKLNNNDSTNEVDQSKTEDKTDVNKISYLSHTTKSNNLTFDYPARWNISVKEDNENNHGYTTTVTTLSGYSIYLIEDPMGGIGGYCERWWVS